MKTIISRPKIKEIIKELDSSGLNIGKEFVFALEGKIVNLIDKAIERCVGNKRRTLQSRDL